MLYSVNLVRQLYVVDANAECVQGNDGSFYFKVKDAQGKTRATQSINPEDVDWIHLTEASAMRINLKKVTVTLDDVAFPSRKTISGEDYILRINFRQFFGMSDEDIYQKYGAVHGTSAMTTGSFIKEMIYSLIKNMSRELADVLTFAVAKKDVAKAVKKGSVVTLYDASGSAITVADTVKTFDIIEKSLEHEWALGTKKLERVYFDVVPTTVTEADTYNEVVWATTAESVLKDANHSISNVYNIADMEYFFHGYRGDIYRMKGWPNVIHTDYMVDIKANKANGYDVVDIQYHYAGDNEDSLESAKTLTLVAPAGTTSLATLAQNAAYCASKKVKKVTSSGVTKLDGVQPTEESDEDSTEE